MLFVLAVAVTASAQDVPRTRGGTTENPPVTQPRAGKKAGGVESDPSKRQQLEKPDKSKQQPSRGVSVTAKLVDPEKQGQQKAAVVQVNVGGLRLVDPDQSGRKATPGQGHLLYRVDGGPVISTTATKLGFRELSSGGHKIYVTVVGNDETPLGPREVLDVTIP